MIIQFSHVAEVAVKAEATVLKVTRIDSSVELSILSDTKETR
jgi:hypothetical protein